MGQNVATSGEFVIRVESGPLFLTQATPDLLVAGQAAAVTLTGRGFIPGTQVVLVAADGTLHNSQSVAIDSFTQATVVFDLGDMTEGVYDMRVTLPDGSSDSLTGAISIVPSAATKLETHLILPRFVVQKAPEVFYVEYANTGTTPMPAAILTVQSADPDSSDMPLLSLDGTHASEARGRRPIRTDSAIPSRSTPADE